MESKIKTWILAPLLCALLAATSCAPITEETRPTNGNAIGTLGGAAAGAGVTAALNAPAPVIGVAGIAGASLGYYLTTQTFSAGGITKVGGKVYTVGEYLTIEIPSDNLFDPNTNEFLDTSDPILDSVVSVLKRFPGHNLIISGNTSGFGTVRFEQRLSQARAEQVASYLWLHGINDNAPNPIGKKRRLIYVGYGDNFPIANNIRLSGIRSNSRIQIVAYPCDEILHWDKIHRKTYKLFDNIGGKDTASNAPAKPDTTSGFDGDIITGKSAPTPPPIADVPMPVQNFAAIDSDSLKQQFNALPTPNKNPVPDSIPPLEAKLSAQEAQAAIDQSSPPSAPQTVVGSNSKKHWGSKEDVTLKDETPPALPSPDPDALPR